MVSLHHTGIAGIAPELYRWTSSSIRETKHICRVYGVWAKFRLPITGRPDMDVIMQEKKTCR